MPGGFVIVKQPDEPVLLRPDYGMMSADTNGFVNARRYEANMVPPLQQHGRFKELSSRIPGPPLNGLINAQRAAMVSLARRKRWFDGRWSMSLPLRFKLNDSLQDQPRQLLSFSFMAIKADLRPWADRKHSRGRPRATLRAWTSTWAWTKEDGKQ